MTTVVSEAKTATKPRPDRPWRLGFQSLEEEVRAPLELDVRGAIPKDLEGALYRIGPARHEVYGERFRSWFDGDGMVHALAISGGKVTYQNRFVETEGKLAEDRAKKRLYAGFATRGPGGPLARLRHRNDRKNPANTNVVFHGGKLLALCEGGPPHRLDPATLRTLGEDDMNGTIAAGATYSAHPKLDPDTGEMWNFGVAYGRSASIDIYRTTREGVTTRVKTVELPELAMIHDFALTRTKVVFVIAPIVLPRIPVALILGQRSFGESLRFRPDLGTRVVVIDRATGEERWARTDAFMMFHTAAAWDDGDAVVVDLCAYPDARLMTTIVDVMAGDEPTPARAYVERVRIGRDGAAFRTRVSRTPLEFPRVAGGLASGGAPRLVYGVSWTDDADFIAAPAVIDTRTGEAEVAKIGPAEYAGECVPVAKVGASSEADVWLLTLVLDAAARTTELRVLDGADLSAPAVARVRLPHVVPFGFHGNWVKGGVPTC